MGKITILPETTKNPITLMGQRAGVCWGANVEDAEKNYKRGLDCLSSGHGRVMEYVNVEMIIDGYSARVIREWYTHLGGAPTRLQASTSAVQSLMHRPRQTFANGATPVRKESSGSSTTIRLKSSSTYPETCFSVPELRTEDIKMSTT